MRIITRRTLRRYWEAHPEAEASLRRWIKKVRNAHWASMADLRQSFPSADTVLVASGRPVVVFDIAHNRHRLITAVHYNTQKVYTLMVLSHAEYDRDTWKEVL